MDVALGFDAVSGGDGIFARLGGLEVAGLFVPISGVGEIVEHVLELFRVHGVASIRPVYA